MMDYRRLDEPNQPINQNAPTWSPLLEPVSPTRDIHQTSPYGQAYYNDVQLSPTRLSYSSPPQTPGWSSYYEGQQYSCCKFALFSFLYFFIFVLFAKIDFLYYFNVFAEVFWRPFLLNWIRKMLVFWWNVH